MKFGINSINKKVLENKKKYAVIDEEYNKIMNEVTTYCDEMVAKFIIGDEPIENYDKFIENIKSMNIDRAVEIKEAAIARFNSR